MKTGALEPKVINRVRFALSERKRVPESSGCYALATFDDDILYVGLTEDLRRRLCEHRDDDAKRQLVNGVLATWFYYAEYPLRELERIERGWMNQYQTLHIDLPPLNSVYSPIR